jgi:hypothetical protein
MRLHLHVLLLFKSSFLAGLCEALPSYQPIAGSLVTENWLQQIAPVANFYRVTD